MDGPEFFQTRMGQHFYEHTMPELVRAVERLAAAVERFADARTSSSPATPAPAPFEVGSSVLIRHNPHHEDGAEIVGTVVAVRPGAGFMGCDLVEVRYVLPRDGSEHVMPFAAWNVDRGDREGLLGRAERHEEMAARMRGMAGASGTSRVIPPGGQ